MYNDNSDEDCFEETQTEVRNRQDIVQVRKVTPSKSTSIMNIDDDELEEESHLETQDERSTRVKSKTPESSLCPVSFDKNASSTDYMKQIIQQIDGLQKNLEKISGKDTAATKDHECEILCYRTLCKQDIQQVYKKVMDAIFPKIKYWLSSDKKKDCILKILYDHLNIKNKAKQKEYEKNLIHHASHSLNQGRNNAIHYMKECVEGKT